MPARMLHPNEISSNWEIISEGVSKDIPNIRIPKELFLANILNGLMSGVLQCWIQYDDSGDDLAKVNVMAVTMIATDWISGMRNLIIYCYHLFSVDGVPDNVVPELSSIFIEFARRSKCHRICYYSDMESSVEFAKASNVNLMFMIYKEV